MKKRANKTPIALRIIQRAFPLAELIAPGFAYRWAFNMFFKPVKFQTPQREKLVEQDAAKFKLEAGGKNIQCYAWGDGPVLLMVHGWAGRGTQFFKFIPLFVAKGYKVVAFDGPAHGASDGKSTNILEFQQVIQALNDYYGELEAIITHSFGGVAAIYSMEKGLPVKNLVNIGSPTDGDKIIEEFVRRINGSPKVAVHFDRLIRKRFGKPFNAFSSQVIAPVLNDLHLLLIHDEHDKEVDINQAYQIKALIPDSEIMVTQFLGHTRILRDDQVVQKSLDFVCAIRQNKLVAGA